MDRPLLAFFGHHKCASSWANAISVDVCRELKIRHRTVHDAGDLGTDLATFVGDEAVGFLAYTNADVREAARLGPLRGFHIVRDPRDVCVSAYFSHLHSHPTHAWPELIAHRQQLESASKEEGLLLELKFNERHFDEMRSWDYGRSDVLELRMEEVVRDPYQQGLRIFSFLGLVDEGDYTPGGRLRYLAAKTSRRAEAAAGGRFDVPYALQEIPAERMLGIIWEHDFAKKSGGRNAGHEDVKSHYRKGLAGDWRNHFTDRVTEAFRERYNDLMLQLGYEDREDWS